MVYILAFWLHLEFNAINRNWKYFHIPNYLHISTSLRARAFAFGAMRVGFGARETPKRLSRLFAHFFSTSSSSSALVAMFSMHTKMLADTIRLIYEFICTEQRQPHQQQYSCWLNCMTFSVFAHRHCLLLEDDFISMQNGYKSQQWGEGSGKCLSDFNTNRLFTGLICVCVCVCRICAYAMCGA